MDDEPLPNRKWLRHEVPFRVNDPYPRFFITVCCKERGRNQLATDEMWIFLRESIKKRNAGGNWNCELFLAMPDHIHGFFSFENESRMTNAVKQWKRWVAREKQIVWQKGFFEHRLRNDANSGEKWDYILQNPVRAGFVEHPKDWPYQYHRR